MSHPHALPADYCDPFTGLPVPTVPGDVLLYSGAGFWSWAIKVKTWSDVSHCEMVGYDETAMASRDGEGVRTYWPIRSEGLYAVLRVRGGLAFDFDAAWEWHKRQRGQRYDWWGLMRFFTLGDQTHDKQFCSEYLTRLLRAGGVEPFARGYDADLVSPGMFLASGALVEVWRRG